MIFRPSLNVWAGIVSNHLLRPHVLPVCLNGEIYLKFLKKGFGDFLDDLLLTVTRNTCAIRVSEDINEVLGKNWMGQTGLVPLLPRSADLNPVGIPEI